METALGTQRCGACGATLRPDAPWCTLCLTPRPLPEPVAAAPGAGPGQAVRTAALYPALTPARIAGELPSEAAATWPCQRCGTPVPLLAAACPDCGSAFLEGAAGPAVTLTLPLIGDLAARSRGQRFAIAAALGGGLAVLAVLFVVLVAAVL